MYLITFLDGILKVHHTCDFSTNNIIPIIPFIKDQDLYISVIAYIFF